MTGRVHRGRRSAAAESSRRLGPLLGPYDLDATLTSGQAFRWRRSVGDDGWESAIGARWVRVRLSPDGRFLEAETLPACRDWGWLEEYLQIRVDLPKVIDGFPDDAPMRRAVATHPGLRLLRQDPWETLAAFILSSTKRIPQIQQMVERLCDAYGERIDTPAGSALLRRFPSAARLASCGEAELRACRLGFRAPYLREAATRIASGHLDLDRLRAAPLDEARSSLMELPGVGRKIAECVLLFAYGFSAAFPVDVWVGRALRELYFRNRPVPARTLERFIETHFGAHPGYAQQYLFHYIRNRRVESPDSAASGPGKAGQSGSRNNSVSVSDIF